MLVDLEIKWNEAHKAALDAFISELMAKVENRSAALKHVGEALLQTTYGRFETGTDPQGRAWKPLSALTVKLRGSASPILWRSGRLRRSISYQVEGDRLALGPNMVDAAAHQFGATIVPKEGKALRIPNGSDGIFVTKVTIPAREYIGFGPKDQAAAHDALLDYFDFEKAGGK